MTRHPAPRSASGRIPSYTLRVRQLPQPTIPEHSTLDHINNHTATMFATAAQSPVGVLPERRNSSQYNRDLALQKYLLLHEQHESLRQHLDELRPLQTSFGTAIMSTPLASPTRTCSSSSIASTSPISPYHARRPSITAAAPTTSSSLCMTRTRRRSSLPPPTSTPVGPFPPPCHNTRSFSTGGTELETVPDETTLAELAVEEAKLCDVNEGIKRTLTELLNCEAVREDRAFRTWVQCRLMDTERELRSGRRRRSAPEV